MMMRKLTQLIFIAILSAVPCGLCAQENPARVESVEIQGNETISDDRLRRVMLLRSSSLFNDVEYDEEILKGDLESVILYYNRNGFLEAEIAGYNVVRREDNRVDIVIYIAEGPRTTIESISFLGNDRIADIELRSALSLQPGAPFRRTLIEQATTELLRKYADNGFLESEIVPDVRINEETHSAIVDFIIDEKEGFRIDDIEIRGLDKTSRNVVMREIKFQPGDVVNYSQLLRTQRELYLTGLFTSVFVRPVAAGSQDSSKRDILIDIQEGDSGEFNVAVGYDTVERLRTRAELYNNNLRGTALKLGTAAKWSTVQNSLNASLTEPRTFGTLWQTDLTASREYMREPGYNYRRIGGLLTVGRRIRESSRLNISYRYDDNRYANVRVTKLPESTSGNTSSIRASYIFDTRNNLFDTTSGIYFELSNEFGGFFVGNVRTFARTVMKFKYFHPIGSGTVLGTSLEAGIIDSENGLAQIPLNERFYAGGPNSIRGFSYRKVGPLDENDKPIGGKLKLVWNVLEVRQHIWRWFNAGIFYDLGNVWINADELDIGQIRHAAGAGLRISTPLGLARLDYGVKLDRRADEDSSAIQFSMGHAF